MKRRKTIISLLLAALCLSLLMIFPVRRASAWSEGYIEDRAGLFSDSVIRSLEQQMQKIEEEKNILLYILTVNELEDPDLAAMGYSYQSIRAFAEDYYDYIICGGVETDGIMLCVDMGSREIWVTTTGSEEKRFSKARDPLLDRVQDCMADGKYDAAARTFVNLVDKKINWGFYPPTLKHILISIGAGLLVGFLAVSSMRAGMKNVHQASNARNYTVPGTFNLRHVEELFLYRNVTRKAREQSSSRSGGGGGGSSGISHGGGGRKF